MALRNVAREDEFLPGMGMKIVTGIWYLGSFSGYRAAEDSWPMEKFQGWT